MNLLDYASILIRRGWIMLLLGIIAAGAAFFFSRGMDPVYRATQKVLIVPSRIDFGLTQAAKQTLNNHVAWLDSSLRAAEVIDLLQLDMSPTQLRGDVRIAPNLDSQVIQIDAESKDPGQAETRRPRMGAAADSLPQRSEPAGAPRRPHLRQPARQSRDRPGPAQSAHQHHGRLYRRPLRRRHHRLRTGVPGERHCAPARRCRIVRRLAVLAAVPPAD